MTRIVCIIPARLESTRMPKKLLRCDTGYPLVVHTVRAARLVGCFDSIAVTSDSSQLLGDVLYHDKEVDLCPTEGVIRSGTDRIAFAIAKYDTDADLIVNIQADEPEIQPEHIRALIGAALMVPGCDMATLAAPLKPGEYEKENVVKVEIDGGYASRFVRWADSIRSETEVPIFHHLGVYAYTPRFLKWFTSLPQTENEKRERLEQFRALDNGARIRVAIVPEAWPGIDTEEEYQAFVKRYKEKSCLTK